MRGIAVRRDVEGEQPSLPVELFRSFSAPKAIAVVDVRRRNFL